MRIPVIVLAALALSACGQKSEEGAVMQDPHPSLDMHRPPSPEQATEGGSAAAPAADATAAPSPVPAGTPMLAYSYRYGLEAPPKAVRELIARHEAACTAAGPAVCQVTASEIQELGEDQVRGSLALRAAPAWLKRFRDGLAGEAKSAGGRVSAVNVNSEDLSRQIVDSEAALRAKTTLRDRLQALLASRPGKLSDLIELERELARVQGEIDATQSELAIMRTRVATSEVTIAYSSTGVLAPEGVLSPLDRALSNVLKTMVGAVAVMIVVAAALAPWVLVVGGLMWLFRKRLPKVRLRRRKTQDTPPAS